MFFKKKTESINEEREHRQVLGQKKKGFTLKRKNTNQPYKEMDTV